MDFQPIISVAYVYIRHFIRHSKTQFLGMAKHPIKINSINKIWLRAAYCGALPKAGLSLELQSDKYRCNTSSTTSPFAIGEPGAVASSRGIPQECRGHPQSSVAVIDDAMTWLIPTSSVGPEPATC
jgi:hypothetical protein